MTGSTGAGGSCCGGHPPPAGEEATASAGEQGFVVGALETAIGTVPRVESRLTAADRRGNRRVRWGIRRMRHTVDPGLYALGAPDERSPVFVSANYKLSFDELRRRLPGRDAWILVLDTDGINVWCAAGKGTFGTDELVARIAQSGLERVVSHRRLIVPQLGAPGVAAHKVQSAAGFIVVFGPVEAADLPAFLDAGYVATPAMRYKRFPLRDRALLIPMELLPALKILGPLALLFLFAGGLGGPGGYWENVGRSGVLGVTAIAAALVGGAILVPLLLPWIPGRAFAAKGALVGAVLAVPVVAVGRPDLSVTSVLLERGAWLLLVPAASAYLGMLFTGASTYTSLSGVRKEMRVAVPLQVAAVTIGLGMWIAARIMA